jgi:hypothetical protein
MLTDPPNIPQGVSAVYITYDYLGLHAAGFGQGDWVTLEAQGTLETLGLVNISETITNANIPALNYDQIAFEIASAKVEFHGVNYSATVNGGRLTRGPTPQLPQAFRRPRRVHLAMGKSRRPATPTGACCRSSRTSCSKAAATRLPRCSAAACN